MIKVVLLGGPPGVGKSSIISRLREQGVASIDADEISPPGTDDTPEAAIAKVIQAAKEKLETNTTLVLSWVFARSALFQPFLQHFSQLKVIQIYIVCTPAELALRLERRGDQSLYNYALQKLQLINGLPFEKIDVTDMDSTDAATAIANRITDAG